MAIGIDDEAEGSICTGSVIFHEGIYYAFYAVRMCDGSPARLTAALSQDGIHFQKSHRVFALQPPYDGASARDPKVIRDENGVFHMFVTTSLLQGEESRGCLAHLISGDLVSWEPVEPLVVLDISDQPECSDYFRLGNLYYLIYSNFGTARYFSRKIPSARGRRRLKMWWRNIPTGFLKRRDGRTEEFYSPVFMWTRMWIMEERYGFMRPRQGKTEAWNSCRYRKWLRKNRKN